MIHEVISAEDLGGAHVHTHVSGVSDHFAVNEKHALQLTRDIVSNLNNKSFLEENSKTAIDSEEPLYDMEDLNGIISTDLTKPYDMRLVLSRVLDGSKFHEFKEKWFGDTLVTGFGRLYGNSVGIVANNGVLFGESA